MEELHRKKIEDYIKAYNSFDVQGMLATLHPDIEFKNVNNGEVTLTVKGIEAFKIQAEQALSFFKQRQQTITATQFKSDEAEVSIDYTGILAVNLPDGPRAGDTIKLKGRSVFRFKQGQIISLVDIA